jgi:NTE family protein
VILDTDGTLAVVLAPIRREVRSAAGRAGERCHRHVVDLGALAARKVCDDSPNRFSACSICAGAASARLRVMDRWLCLSGGNALGAFHAGAWAAIEDAGLNVTRISGASIGAVIGAIIVGSAPGERREALSSFLQYIGRTVFPWTESMRRSAATRTMLMGHADLFSPSMPGLAEIFPGMPRDPSAFLRGNMRRTLERHVDFARLNASDIELSVTAVDANTGRVEVFRSGETTLIVDHLMASTALPLLFRPVEIDGRFFMDAGVAENLPLPALLDRQEPAEIIALDLYGLTGSFGPSLNSIAHRTQDLVFGSQSRHVLDACRREGRAVNHIILRDPDDDFVGKAFDFGHPSLRRWRRLGQEITAAALTRPLIDEQAPTEAAADQETPT